MELEREEREKEKFSIIEVFISCAFHPGRPNTFYWVS